MRGNCALFEEGFVLKESKCLKLHYNRNSFNKPIVIKSLNNFAIPLP